MKILIVAAHPDDEVLGMGGTILRHSKLKDIVKIVYLATGISSRQKYDDEIKSKKLSELNKNRIKHTFNIINNTLIINKNDYDTTQKLLSKSYYTQNTYKLIK